MSRLLLSGIVAVTLAGCEVPHEPTLPEADAFRAQLFAHATDLYDSSTGLIEIVAGDVTFTIPGRPLNTGRVEPGYLNNVRYELRMPTCTDELGYERKDLLFVENGRRSLVTGFPTEAWENGTQHSGRHITRGQKDCYRQGLLTLTEYLQQLEPF